MSLDVFGSSIHRVGSDCPRRNITPTGASTTTSLATRQKSVSHPASFRKTPRPAVCSDGSRPYPNAPSLCLRSLFWAPFPGGHGSRSQRFPATRSDRLSQSQGPKLTAANGSNIRTYGKRTISLKFNDRHFKWTFTIAQVSQPLLGADFLRAHSLLVDLKVQRLIDPSDFTSITLRSVPHLDSIESAHDEFARLLAKFPDVSRPSFSHSPPKHGVELFLPTKGPLLHARARRLPPDKLKLAKEEFKKVEELGIFRCSNSQWASPLHTVPKLSGGWRPCGDF